MGLDMYLYAEKYIGQNDYTMVDNKMTREVNPTYLATLKSAGLDNLPTPDLGSVMVAKCVGYWRKANAIHGWFVRELANGVDECQRIRVDKDDLIKLRDLCVNALANRSEAVPNDETTRVINLDESNTADIPTMILNEWKEQQAKKYNNAITLDDPLAPTEGFFFGSTEKDEWYYKDLEYTVETINSILANADQELDYYYQASW